MGTMKDWLNFAYEAISSTGLDFEGLETFELGNVTNTYPLKVSIAILLSHILGLWGYCILLLISMAKTAPGFDLSKQIRNEQLLGRFNVVTNLGTSERAKTSSIASRICIIS